MLKHRLPVGAALIALALALAWLDETLAALWSVRGVAIGAVGAAVVALGGRELALMLRTSGSRLPASLGAIGAMAGFLAVWFLAVVRDPAVGLSILLATLACWTLASVVSASWGRRIDGALTAVAGSALIFLLLGLIPGAFMLLRQHHTAWTLIAVILVVKSCDMGAYFTGRAIGRRKLIPWLSPGKTWEGLAGGALASALAAAGLVWIAGAADMSPSLGLHLTIADGAMIGLVLGLIGQAGDLTISLFKRDAGFKDASATLPGLGGVLDVIDSLLLAAPTAHVLLLWLNR